MQVLSMELGNGLADRVVSAGSVPPPWGGQSSSPKGLTLYLWLRPQWPRGGKNSLVCPTSKAQVCGQLISRSCGAAVWVGQGFRGFLDLRGKIFFLSRNTWGCLATADRVFLFIFYPWNLHGQYRLNFYSPNSNNDHLNPSFWSV